MLRGPWGTESWRAVNGQTCIGSQTFSCLKKSHQLFQKKIDGLQWKHAVQSFLLPSHSFEACNQSVNESDLSHALGVQHGTQLATSNCDLWMSANLSIPFCSLASKSQTFKPLCHFYEQNSCWLVLVHARAQASIMYDLAMELLRHATIDIHSTLDCLSLKTWGLSHASLLHTEN